MTCDVSSYICSAMLLHSVRLSYRAKQELFELLIILKYASIKCNILILSVDLLKVKQENVCSHV